MSVPGRIYADRREAGRALADRLAHRAGEPGVIVLALPRGGVPVAAELARAIRAPLDVLVVRKLGVPGHEELAMGAIATGDTVVLNDEVIALAGVTGPEIVRVAARERRELERRAARYRGGRPPPPLTGRRAIIVDDGLATGATMRAAVTAVAHAGARAITVAVPVAAREALAVFAGRVDELVCPASPEPFRAVGAWYVDFSATADDEVIALLAEAQSRQ